MRNGIKDLGFGWRAGRVKSPKRPSRGMGEFFFFETASLLIWIEEEKEKMGLFLRKAPEFGSAQPCAACGRSP